MKFNNRLDSFAQYIQRNVLVGRMDGVGLQTESHQYGFDAQYLLECRDDRNAATATYCQRLFAESFGEAFLRSLVCRERDGAYISCPPCMGVTFTCTVSGAIAMM